jgi:sialic acid synthase SpsE/2'-5' RNA ligase
MGRYAIVIPFSEPLNTGLVEIAKEISGRFDTYGGLNYPPHIPIKYGFNFDDEAKLKQLISKVNNHLQDFMLEISSAKFRDDSMAYFSVKSSENLERLRQQVHRLLRDELQITDFREAELASGFEYHLTVAEGNLTKDKNLKIVEFLNQNTDDFSCNVSRICALKVIDGKLFPLEELKPELKLELNEENNMNQISNIFERLSNQRPFIIAEISSNHLGEMSVAKAHIDAAVEAGCDAVKFQSWTWQSLFNQEFLDANPTATAKGMPEVGLEAQYLKLALSYEDHVELKKYCDEKGIIFSSSVFSKKEVDMLVEVGAPFLKIASMDLTNDELLSYAASKGIPLVVSTGMATLSEIAHAVDVIRRAGNEEFVLMHCVSIYPAPAKNVNLNNIKMLKQTFKVPVGFSDHTKDPEFAIASIAVGACVIESHFMLEDGNYRDQGVSLVPSQMKHLCEYTRKVATALGEYNRVLSEKEIGSVANMRRSLFTTKEMPVGYVIVKEDLVFKRPGTGIDCNDWKYFVGRKVKQAVEADKMLRIEDLE